MDYEKKYKDALERAKHALNCDRNNLVSTDIPLIYSMFPELKKNKDEKKQEDSDFIDIPFGAFDSELYHQEIYIPDGFEATIKDNKVILKRKENEDERIRKAIHIYLDWLDGRKDYAPKGEYSIKDMIAWLEKKGESYTKRDVDNAFVEGMAFAKNELEKQIIDVPKWKYKKDHTPLLRDSIILNKYGGVAKSPSGAIISDAWILDYDELIKLPKEELEKKGEQKFAAKNIVEIWKDMRFEVYAQADGNRHEPNYSDNSTKMFSLNDIDEIIEKMSEQKPQGKSVLEAIKEEKIDNAHKIEPKDYRNIDPHFGKLID